MRVSSIRRRLFRKSDLPRTFWFLWVGTIINRLGGFVIPFLTLYLTSRRGLSLSQAALMVSLFGAGSFAANLVGGELADRLGRRPVLLVSFFAAPLAMLAVGFARGAAVIAGATLVLGFFTDLYRPAVSATVADVVPPEGRPRAYGYIYWAVNLGAAIAPLLAGVMARMDYMLLFIGDALTTFAFGLFVLWGVAETRPAAPPKTSLVAPRPRLAAISGDPLLLVFTALALVFGTVYQQGIVTLPIEMRSHGLSPELYGLVIAINGALIVLLGVPASHSASRWPRFGALAVAGVLLGTGFGITGLATNLAIFGLSVVVWTLGEIAGATVAPAVVADLSPIDMRGLYQGVFGAAWGLSFFTGPMLGGWILDRFGSAALWGGCFVAGVLAGIGYLAMAPAARRRMRAIAAQETAG